MDIQTQLATALAGRYDIEREVGRGGMATVFLAHDRRHGRRVALKVLDPELGAVLGAERFLSEIRVTASLQHPNLLPLFDSGDAGGLLFYVMPFVEGESLRARIERERQLPVAEAVRLASAIASALDYAHRQGIIHRDLKPENILLQDGQALIADFGIALALSNAGGARVTQTGLSLGTPQYMSPEQATGDRVIDARSDIYSLGAILYEMLTGESPHTGNTAQAVIARLLTEKPRELAESRPSVPLHVQGTVMRALEKLPADRFDSAREFAEALEGKGAVHHVRHQPEGRSHMPWRSIALAAMVCLTLGFGLARVLWKDGGAETTVVRFPLTVPPDLRVTGLTPGFAISDRGDLIAFRASQADGSTMLYTRTLDDLTPRPVKGTNGASWPSISPDNQWIAYNDTTRLTKVAVNGGTPVMLANVQPMGIAWTTTGQIVYGSRDGLQVIEAEGGPPRTLTTVDRTRGGAFHWFPVVLDDQKTVLFAARDSTKSHIGVARLAGGAFAVSAVESARPLGMLNGRLLYVSPDGRLLAVPFDLEHARVTGPSVELLAGIGVTSAGAGNVQLSRSGTLVYDIGYNLYELLSVDSRGIARGVTDSVYGFRNPSLSPDGRRIAIGVEERGGWRIYLIDREARTMEPLTKPRSNAQGPAWSPDGKRILCSLIGPSRGLAIIDLEGDRTPRVIVPGATWGVLTSDGRGIVYTDGATSTVRYRMLGDTVDRVIDEASMAARVSPDGRWVAYHSGGEAAYQVFVRPLAGGGARRQISVDGGQAPVWSPDGKQLLYSAAGRYLIAATLSFANEVSVVRRDTVFGSHTHHTAFANYQYAPDGRGLLVLVRNPRGNVIVARNWTAEAARRLAGKP